MATGRCNVLGLVAVMLIPEIALRRVGPGLLGRLAERVPRLRRQGGPGHGTPRDSV